MSLIIESIISYDLLSGSSDTTTFPAANRNSVQYIDVNVRIQNYKIPETDDRTDGSYFMMVEAFESLTGEARDDRTVHTTDPTGFPEDRKN